MVIFPLLKEERGEKKNERRVSFPFIRSKAHREGIVGEGTLQVPKTTYGIKKVNITSGEKVTELDVHHLEY